MTDLIGGRVDFLCEIITTAKAQVDGGTVKAIATLASSRSPALPNVPTAAEQGFADMEAYTWNAFFLPKGAPADVVKKLNEATVEAMKDPGVRAKLEGLGAQFVSPERTKPDYLAKFVRSEIEKWAKPIKAAGVSAD
jgi:tripartite-type tricarboxylate transporter receptor subunit TctC